MRSVRNGHVGERSTVNTVGFQIVGHFMKVIMSQTTTGLV